MNKRNIVLFAVIAIGGLKTLAPLPVKANIMAIKEAEEHLIYLSSKRTEAQSQFDRAKERLNALKDAENAQAKAVAMLKKADLKKQEAEARAAEAEKVEAQYTSYLSDNFHSSGGAKVLK